MLYNIKIVANYRNQRYWRCYRIEKTCHVGLFAKWQWIADYCVFTRLSQGSILKWYLDRIFKYLSLEDLFYMLRRTNYHCMFSSKSFFRYGKKTFYLASLAFSGIMCIAYKFFNHLGMYVLSWSQIILYFTFRNVWLLKYYVY